MDVGAPGITSGVPHAAPQVVKGVVPLAPVGHAVVDRRVRLVAPAGGGVALHEVRHDTGVRLGRYCHDCPADPEDQTRGQRSSFHLDVHTSTFRLVEQNALPDLSLR